MADPTDPTDPPDRAQPGTTRNRRGACEPFEVKTVPAVAFSKGRFGVTFQDLGRFAGGSQASVRLEQLEPGRQATPAHYHTHEEQHIYVLEGSMRLRLGPDVYTMRAGQYVCFPAGQNLGHALINAGSAPCRYLIVGVPHAQDAVVHTDSEQVRPRVLGQGAAQDGARTSAGVGGGEGPPPAPRGE